MVRSNRTEVARAMTEIPEPEVDARPKRRNFSASYKLQILQQVDACKESGEIGAILRREGLYSSHLVDWRRQRDQGALLSLAKKRGRKTTKAPLSEEVERLRRENARLRERLEQAETIIEVQKKISEILGIPLKNPKPDGSDS